MERQPLKRSMKDLMYEISQCKIARESDETILANVKGCLESIGNKKDSPKLRKPYVFEADPEERRVFRAWGVIRFLEKAGRDARKNGLPKDIIDYTDELLKLAAAICADPACWSESVTLKKD